MFQSLRINEMLCAIWYHLYNLKNLKNTHVKNIQLQPATLLKVTLFHGCFLRFLNFVNGTKSYKASQMFASISEAFGKRNKTQGINCLLNDLTVLVLVKSFRTMFKI